MDNEELTPKRALNIVLSIIRKGLGYLLGHKFLSMSLAILAGTVIAGLAAIFVLIPCLSDNSDEEEVQPKSLYADERDPVKIKNNLSGFCNKEHRVLNRDELYQRAVVDRMRKMLETEKKREEKDGKNGFGIFKADKILMSSTAMTREQFIQNAKLFKKIRILILTN